MDNVKDNKYYAAEALEHLNILQKYFNNRTYEEFTSDIPLLDAIMFRLIQMVENIKNITDDVKESYPNIPWGKIIGFRNGIVHEYGKTDYSIVYEVITQDLDVIKDILESII